MSDFGGNNRNNQSNKGNKKDTDDQDVQTHPKKLVSACTPFRKCIQLISYVNSTVNRGAYIKSQNDNG